MIIRWVPSVVEVVAYDANLMHISSFLGLGLGALVSLRGWRLFGRFSLFLALAIGAFLACRHVGLSASEVEFRFFASSPRLGNYLPLVGVFVANAALFANLIGATLGGFAEYLGMVIGHGDARVPGQPPDAPSPSRMALLALRPGSLHGRPARVAERTLAALLAPLAVNPRPAGRVE